MVKVAVGLLSGGLDSAIAAYLIHEQGYKIEAVNIDTGFISENSGKLQKLSEKLDINLKYVDVFNDYIHILEKPRFGFGKNMNPCIDCRILMYKRAAEIMEEKGADFIFTGEVLEQRPFSQTYLSLKKIEKESGLEGKIVRPLSAVFFPPTPPELDGRLNRSMFLAVKGRRRKLQNELASLWQLSEFNSPGGGCLLTDPGFSKRLKDWFQHEGKLSPLDRKVVELLKIGRHFRFSEDCRLVVGRNESENNKIQMEKADGRIIYIKDVPGPTALLLGNCEVFINDAVKIVTRYSDAREGERVKAVVENGKKSRTIPVVVSKKITYRMIK